MKHIIQSLVHALLISVLLLVISVNNSQAQVFANFSYQGVLKDAVGSVLTGSYNLLFKIYNSETGGTAVYQQNNTGVDVQKGVFNIILDNLSDITFDQQYWLGITVNGGQELTPRIKFAVPYSVNTIGSPNNIVTTSKIMNGTVTPGKINTTNASSMQALIFNGSNDFRIRDTMVSKLPLWKAAKYLSNDEYYFTRYNIKTRTEKVLDSTKYFYLRNKQYQSGNNIYSTKYEKRNSIESFSDLSKVSNPFDYPWRLNCLVIIYFSSGVVDQGSGILIDPKHLLTAGHVVYSDSLNKYADSIHVIPAFYDGEAPFGAAKATNLFTWKGWEKNQDYDWDMGLIELDRPLGALTGSAGYGYNNNDTYFSNKTFNNPGYPAENPYNGEYMYNWNGSYDKVKDNLLYINKTCFGGQSGSGSFTTYKKSPTVYAELSFKKRHLWYPFEMRTGEVRITPQKYGDISYWISRDTPSTPDLMPLYVKTKPTQLNSGDQLSSLSFLIFNYSKSQWNSILPFEIVLSRNRKITKNYIVLQKICNYLAASN